MRTDSVNLSGQAIAAATEYIKRLYGADYSTVRKFKTKNASAQEAHEAIRPTDISLETASSNEYDQKLYDLIRRRTLASQMSPAKLENTTVTITVSTRDEIFEAKGKVVVFDGFMRVYGASKDELLPTLKSGDTPSTDNVIARQSFAKPPARYTEGSLVKKLEELGIGRPSTYATIIDTVQTRGYVIKGEGEGIPRDVIVLTLARVAQDDTAETQEVVREVIQEKTGADKGKLVPTPSGELIADFLTDHFTQIVDYKFTANVEEYFDKIATGALARNVMLDGFYKPFHELIVQSGGIDRSKVGANREVGIDPKSGKPIFARFGRFGPMLQLGSQDSDEKPTFAPLPRGVKIETVTLEEALHAFKLPRLVGQTADGQDIKANIGRFGPYIQVGKLFVSIKPIDPHDITLEQALELYAEKLKAEAEKNIADFGDGIKVLNGRFGPYITDGKKNVKVPKDSDPKEVTHEQAKQMIADAPAAKRRPTRRATTKKK
jgi:DNA topoisomerase-1